MAEQNKMNIETVIHIVYDFYIHSNDIAYHIILKLYSSVRRPAFETRPRDFIIDDVRVPHLVRDSVARRAIILTTTACRYLR